MAIHMLSLFVATFCAASAVANPAPFASIPATLSGRSLKLRSMRAQIALNPSAPHITSRLSGANLTMNDLETLTSLSSELDNGVKSINILNAGLRGGQVSTRLGEIVARTTRAGQDFAGMTPLADADAVRVIAALQDFVKAHSALLNSVIGKHGTLSLYPYAKPIRSALVALEAAVDRCAYALIDLVPTRHNEGVRNKLMLDSSIQTAIVVYSK